MISFNPFWDTLKRKNITSYALINRHKVSSGTINRMRSNSALSTNTINHLCKVLECRVEEILVYLPDLEDE